MVKTKIDRLQQKLEKKRSEFQDSEAYKLRENISKIEREIKLEEKKEQLERAKKELKGLQDQQNELQKNDKKLTEEFEECRKAAIRMKKIKEQLASCFPEGVKLAGLIDEKQKQIHQLNGDISEIKK